MPTPRERAQAALRLVMAVLIGSAILWLVLAISMPVQSARPWMWALFGASLVSIGCVVAMMLLDARSNRPAPAPVVDATLGRAAIQITRAQDWKDQGRPYKVLIDRHPCGALFVGETKQFVVGPGTHEVGIRIDWSGSSPLRLEVGEGETAALSCKPKGSGVSRLVRVFSRHGWVDLMPGPLP